MIFAAYFASALSVLFAVAFSLLAVILLRADLGAAGSKASLILGGAILPLLALFAACAALLSFRFARDRLRYYRGGDGLPG